MEKPLVSVIMPVYNAEKFLRPAIDSVLNQSFKDFELLALDDGSTDQSLKVLKQYAARDQRIKVFAFKHCGNVGKVLNRGCKLAKGKYLARADADDICLPKRFDKQVKFLEQNQTVAVVGSWVEYIDEQEKVLGIWRTPVSGKEINWKLLFGNALAHSSVMMRRDILKKAKFYRAEKINHHIEDFDLWARLIRTQKIINLPEVLTQRRVYKASDSNQFAYLAETGVVRIINQQLKDLLGRRVDRSLIIQMRRVFFGQRKISLFIKFKLFFLSTRIYLAFIMRQQLTLAEIKFVTRDLFDKYQTIFKR